MFHKTSSSILLLSSLLFSALPVAAVNLDSDQEKLRQALQDALQARGDEALPGGVKRLQSVSIQKSKQPQIIVKWAINDWLRLASNNKEASLFEGAQTDLAAMLIAVASADVYYDSMSFEGTLPIDKDRGRTEEVVIKVVYNRSGVQGFASAILSQDTLSDSGTVKILIRLGLAKYVAQKEDVFRFAQEKWMRPELTRKHL